MCTPGYQHNGFVPIHALGHEHICTCISVYVYIPIYNSKFQVC